jgi:hypothetical protein
MNRYDVFRLVQELGQLIEGAHDKTGEEVARDLIACGQRKLAEATAGASLKQLINGTTIPLLPPETPISPGAENPAHPVTVPTSTGNARA